MENHHLNIPLFMLIYLLSRVIQKLFINTNFVECYSLCIDLVIKNISLLLLDIYMHISSKFISVSDYIIF